MKTLIGNVLHVVFASQPFCFRIDCNGDAAALPVCVIPATAPYIEYINFQAENFHLAVISKGFELIVRNSERQLVTYLLRQIILILF